MVDWRYVRSTVSPRWRGRLWQMVFSSRFGAVCCALVLGALAAGPALAHPHVWVTSRSTLVYDTRGRFTGVEQNWTFDDMFSSFATQGLDTNGDGKLSREELQPLAKTNTESLKEFGYFTTAKLDSKLLLFRDPVDYWLEQVGTVLTLHFFLPLNTPQPQGRKPLVVDVYDPTYYVDFTMDKTNPAELKGAPSGCKLDVVRPPDPSQDQQADAMKLDQDYFSALVGNKNFGAQFINHILVNCP